MTESRTRSSGLEETRAKEYQRIKKQLSLVHLLLTPALLFLWIVTPLAGLTGDFAVSIADVFFMQIALFFTLFSLFFFLIDLPFSFYSGFMIEHRFGLSNLTFKKWAAETFKRSMLSFLLSLILLEALYFFIASDPQKWWLWAWVAYAAVTWVMGTLFPVLIVPMFYRYQPLGEGELKDRILALLSRHGLPPANLLTLNLSKTTKKANAAFMGIGKTKRVVLSDTLIENFSPEEIEQVVAHELGHFKHRDIWKQLGLGLVISFFCFIAGFTVLGKMTVVLDLHSTADPAGLPLLLLVFLVLHYLSLPLVNGFSRRCEYAADHFALEACRDKNIFISMMEKLGKVNLADPDPAPWYEWIFYSHPSIRKRILAAQQWSLK